VIPNLGVFTRTYDANDKFFNKLNFVSAYWAGFIASDGNLHKNCLSISLNQRDIEHLNKFKKAVNFKGPLHHVGSNNSVAIQIFSKEIINTLTKKGITPNKSLTISRVDIPKNLISHFLRGVFDGDGSISGRDRSHVQFNIAGNKSFLEQIQKILICECNLNKTKIYPLPSKAYKLQYTGSQIFRILNFLYSNSTKEIRLNRKYEKYLKFIKTFKKQKKKR
jgi:hypothetical protein